MIVLDRKRLVIWALLTVASVIVLAACGSSKLATTVPSSGPPEPVAVRVATVIIR